LLRQVNLCLLLGQSDRALSLLADHHFRRWEGENGPHAMYVDAHLLRGQRSMATGEYGLALQDFLAAAEYPENLETGRPWAGGQRDPKIHYLTATAYEALGRQEQAKAELRRVVSVESSWPEAWYYRGLAYRRLGHTPEADAQFAKLVRSGEDILRDGWPPDFFGIFGTEPPETAWKAEAHFRIGLGCLGQGKTEEARRHFDAAARFGMDHLGVQTCRSALEKP
jgi:tetratricopeptide (TPR) repeat protein